MKKLAAITLTSMMLLLATAMVVGAVDSMDIRGAVAGTVNGQSNLEGDSFTWNPQNFAGFYYDIKKDIGTEKLVTSLTEGNKLSGDAPYGVTYTTTAQAKDYEFEDWGSYKVIGFQAEKYFAGYMENADANKNIFFKESTDENSLSSEQLEKILVDDDTEKTVTSGTPLKLEEGYELSIKSIDIDGNKVYIELSKDGSVVDSKVISPSKDGATMADKTYYYKNPAVGDQKKLVTVAAHFKNAFRGADQNLATVDGLWQVSDVPTEVKADTQYDKMTIRTVDATNGVITMDNKDNAITLSKNKDSALMAGVKIKTADNDTLRFYIYKTITEPGEYQIRGKVATEGATWDPQNFAGFYYDIKKDIGKEQITTVLTEGNKLSGDAPYGVTYTTTAQAKDYEFEDWGSYNVIGFQAEKYFAGYIANEDAAKNIFFKESTDENSLSSEQLEKILVDDDTEKTVTSGTPLKLEEGYELSIKSIDIDGNKVYIELSKDGSVVDSKVISPSKDGATMADKTYYYKNPAVGDQKKLVTVAAHFKNAFRGADQNLATVDGLWQVSDVPTEVKADTQYDKMTIRTVDATNGVITMDNKDNAITLSKNKDSALMAGVNIKTADNDTLRYYIYKAVTIEGAAAPVTEAAPVVEAAPAVENKTVEAPAAEAAPVVVENKTAEAPAAEPAKAENKTAEPVKTQPGFESIFAITGLLAVAFLVLSRRE